MRDMLHHVIADARQALRYTWLGQYWAAMGALIVANRVHACEMALACTAGDVARQRRCERLTPVLSRIQAQLRAEVQRQAWALENETRIANRTRYDRHA